MVHQYCVSKGQHVLVAQRSSPTKPGCPFRAAFVVTGPRLLDTGLLQYGSRGCGAAGVVWPLLLPRNDSSPLEYVSVCSSH